MRKIGLIAIFSFAAITSSVAFAEQSVEKININTASQDELDRLLEDVGEKKAKAIVEYREKNGPFTAVEDMKNVYGIGDKFIEKNRDRIILSNPEQSMSSEQSVTGEKSEEISKPIVSQEQTDSAMVGQDSPTPPVDNSADSKATD